MIFFFWRGEKPARVGYEKGPRYREPFFGDSSLPPGSDTFDGNINTLPQQSIIAKLRLDLNSDVDSPLDLSGDADSPLSCCSRANDYRERIDLPGVFGDRAWDWESCDRGGLDPVRCECGSEGEANQAEGATGVQGGSVQHCDWVHRFEILPKLEKRRNAQLRIR